MNKSIAIIIPVYNVEKYLVPCLESVIKQTIKPNEVLLIDDGSTDNSGIICDKYSKDYKYIKTIHQKNKGLSEARNTGINNIHSKYFILLDSDDTIEENTIEQFNNFISDTEQPEIVVGNVLSHWPNRIIKKKHSIDNSNNMVEGKTFLKEELKKKTMFYESVQSMYSKDFIKNNDLYFEKDLIHEDQLFTIKVLLLATKVLPTDITFYNHIIRENSISTKKDKSNNAKSIIKICYLVEELVKNLSDKELKNMILDHCVDLYYRVYLEANLLDKPSIRIKKEYLINNSFSKKNKLRTFLYNNEKIFYMFEKIRKKGR